MITLTPLNDILTTAQAAEYLREHGYKAKRTHEPPLPVTITHWCQKGKLKATKTNPSQRGVWLIPRSELDRLIVEQKERERGMERGETENK